MHDQELVDELVASGHVGEQQVMLWRDVAGLMAVFDAIGRDGVSAVVKIDGARPDAAMYTVVVSGPRLGEAFFRQDGSDLPALLSAAIAFYRAAAWSGPHTG
ncbi:hypothetical protein [Tahibacter aquaticus]|uniref:hypothetical protein n=1 Tax=Tahibacter aquaticus TaxID=520092 RepID=UPI00105B938D|nr:hypothetical protein [Tahibacter aquaticus]